MWRSVSAPREFWLGILYLLFGIAGAYLASAYPFGTAGRMGPGYLPTVISGLLIVFGIASLARAFLMQGDPVGALALRALLSVVAGVAAFALLVERAGLIVAIVALVLISASASDRFKIELKPMIGLVAFTAVCAIVFVQFLGVPMPLIGRWFGR